MSNELYTDVHNAIATIDLTIHADNPFALALIDLARRETIAGNNDAASDALYNAQSAVLFGNDTCIDWRLFHATEALSSAIARYSSNRYSSLTAMYASTTVVGL